MSDDRMEQAITCFSCLAAELLLSDSDRMQGKEWPAWEPGLQTFDCPSCGAHTVWATEPRTHEEAA